MLKPLCDSDELISVGNGCECNVAKGYWGDDSRNCQLNINNCKQAGQQLRKTDGTCVSCEGDKFKPEEDAYGICREKKKCKAGEEEVDPGSIKRDRRCQAIQIVITSTLAPPTIMTNTEPPNEEEGNDDGGSILSWLLPVCVVSAAVICVTVYLCWKYRIQIQERFKNLCCQRCDTRNRSESLEFQHRNGILQNEQKHSDCNSNGSVNPEEEHLLDSSLLDGHTKDTDDSVNAEIGASQTCLKSIEGNDDKYTSFGKSIFDYDKSTSLEQNNESLIGTQTSTASNHETSPDNANNTGGNSDYDTARTGSTGNIPDITQNHANGEVPKTKAASSMTETGSEGNIPESDLFHSLNTIPSNTTPNHRKISNSKATETPTNKTRPTATASCVTGNTEAPTDNGKPIAKVGPYIPEAPTSNRPQETTAPDNHDQRFPASRTTAGGIDIQTPVNEERTKVVPNALYPLEQPSHVNMPESLDDNVAVGGSSRNDDSIVTETGSEPTHVNVDGGNRDLPPEETSESLDDYVTVGGASRNVIETGSESQFSVDQRTSAGENGSGLLTVHGNPLAAPESTSTTSSNEPSLPLVESENLDSII